MTTTNEAQVSIRNKLGMHARPAAHFVKLSSQFRSEVLVGRDDVEVNGKSIMGVMMLAAEQGAVIFIRAVGEDSAEAVQQLVALVERGFDEDDDGRAVMNGGARGG